MLHNVAETARASFPEVDKLVSSVKKNFKKSPKRIQAFKNTFPLLSLPPEPVVTRWGTWLKAVDYISQNHEKSLSVIETFNEGENAAFLQGKNMLSNASIIRQLHQINKNFALISNALNEIENTLSVPDIISMLNRIRDNIGDPAAMQKFQQGLDKNEGFTVLKTFVKGCEKSDPLENWTTADLALAERLPLQNCNAERAFSRFNDVLTDRRTNLTEENLSKFLFAMCNVYF